MTDVWVGSMRHAGVRRSGGADAVPEGWGRTWYLNATVGRLRRVRSSVYSPAVLAPSGEEVEEGAETKAGFGATFSSVAKFSRRIAVFVATGGAEGSIICVRASSPMMAERVTVPAVCQAEIVSMREACRPGVVGWGCWREWFRVLVERMEAASEEEASAVGGRCWVGAARLVEEVVEGWPEWRAETKGVGKMGGELDDGAAAAAAAREVSAVFVGGE